MTSGPLEMGLTLAEGRAAIHVKGKLFLHVQEQKDPFSLDLTLEANELEAAGSA